MSGFQWTKKRERVALALAQGHTVSEAAKGASVTERTVYRWKNDLNFATEVDRLSLMTGIASRAERLRIVMQIARQKVGEDGLFDTSRDLLDWLKFAQSETDGAKLDLATIFEAMETATGDGAPPDGESEKSGAGSGEES